MEKASEFDTLDRFLLERQFSKHEQRDQFRGSKFLYQRRINNVEPLCALNDKLLLNVLVSSFPVNGTLYEGAEVELTAQQPDQQWAKLMIYSLNVSDVINGLDGIERKLIRAWLAVNQAD